MSELFAVAGMSHMSVPCFLQASGGTVILSLDTDWLSLRLSFQLNDNPVAGVSWQPGG